MNIRIMVVSLLMVMPAMGCTWHNIENTANSVPGTSIQLLPRAATFELDKVPHGIVGFTATIKNSGTTTITIAHPSICLPAGYLQGDVRRFNDSHGKSEILLKITKPDGAETILRDGHFHYFDPGNFPLMTIPPNGAGSFDVGWFFQNARGRWENDDEAAKVFLSKGTYGIRILLRNVYPRAVLYDENTRGRRSIGVWTGEIQSGEITVEVR